MSKKACALTGSTSGGVAEPSPVDFAAWAAGVAGPSPVDFAAWAAGVAGHHAAPKIEMPYEASKAISGLELGKILHDAGLVPPECRRIVIDINVGSVVVVHFETLAQRRLLDVLASTISPTIVGSTHQITIPKETKIEMKNAYGYESYLDVPLPRGEVMVDIREPRTGERFLHHLGEKVFTKTEDFYICTPRIILGAAPKKRYATARIELMDGESAPFSGYLCAQEHPSVLGGRRFEWKIIYE